MILKSLEFFIKTIIWRYIAKSLVWVTQLKNSKFWCLFELFFSDSTGQTNCTLCPLGYYCVENSTAFSEQLCPPGYYCPVGTSNPYQYPCPKGTYNPANASHSISDCLTCPPGEYCESQYICTCISLCLDVLGFECIFKKCSYFSQQIKEFAFNIKLWFMLAMQTLILWVNL